MSVSFNTNKILLNGNKENLTDDVTKLSLTSRISIRMGHGTQKIDLLKKWHTNKVATKNMKEKLARTQK